MKRIFLILVACAALNACEKKKEPNKILDGLPVNTEEVVPLGQATQEIHVMTQDALNTIVTAMNRLSQTSPSFSDLTNVGFGQYQFTRSGSRYGSATFTITFKDGVGATIDPIANTASTSTFKSVDVTGTGSSSRFSYTIGTWTITLLTEGVPTSDKTLAGPTTFTSAAPSYTINYTYTSAEATFEGVTDGTLSATGTGPSAPITLTVTYASDRVVNGTLTWEGQSGGIHLASNGTGFIVTDTSRLLLN